MLNSEVHHSVSAQNKQTYLAPWSENIIKISLSSKERKEKSGTANSEDVSKLSDLIRCWQNMEALFNTSRPQVTRKTICHVIKNCCEIRWAF